MKGLTLQVEPGEVFGFLGPNGAGKTTSMKMLLGLVAPTSGTASLLGAPIGDLPTRARVGFLPEHFRFQDWLTAREFLFLHGQLLGMESRDLRTRLEELLERMQGIGDVEIPLVWNHESGRKSLVIGNTAHTIVGKDHFESVRILNWLREWATQEQFTYSHEWSVGDMIIWDNTGVMHRVEKYPADSGRLLSRTTLVGEEAIA